MTLKFLMMSICDIKVKKDLKISNPAFDLTVVLKLV